MLEKPDLPDECIVACVQDNYGVRIAQIVFLPLGADANAAVYRLVTEKGVSYFLKVRRGGIDETGVILPRYLSDQGIKEVIAPIATQSRQLWTDLGDYRLILYPFVEGKDGFTVDLTDRQWIALGRGLRRVHTLHVPDELSCRLQRESYSSYWRKRVRGFQADVEARTFDEPVAAKYAALLKSRRAEIQYIVARAEQLGKELQTRKMEFVLCHADLHGGNVLVDANGDLYMVDWDNPVLAPKERDLMFIGAGVAGVWNKASEETPFYQGYGEAAIDPTALAYYRYERIVEDFAAYCEQLLSTTDGGDDREVAFQQVADQFLPNNVIEIANRTDLARSEGKARKSNSLTGAD